MKTILTAALAAALFVTSAASAAPSEKTCLTVATLAEAYGEARDVGRTEKELLASIENASIRPFATLLIKMVFTLELGKVEARKQAYLKCLGGTLDPLAK